MVSVVKHCSLLVQGKRGLQRKIIKDCCRICPQENIICMFSKLLSDRSSVLQIAIVLYSCFFNSMFTKLSYSCNDRKFFCESASTH